jgi:hypothetical protein
MNELTDRFDHKRVGLEAVAVVGVASLAGDDLRLVAGCQIQNRLGLEVSASGSLLKLEDTKTF